MQRIYRCALYARLSREDGDGAESESILNQFELLSGYCESSPELVAAARYADDGYTGTNFERPGFLRMMRDAAEGRIDCIVVKDLSRFGRDYIETGRYLERILPQKGIRFIAVNDHVDSIHGEYDLTLPIRNIFNAQYSRDISKKIRSALNTKRAMGEFIGAFCSYGYRRDEAVPGRLVVDEPAAAVVRQIFSMYESGMGKDAIAKRLNGAGIPCPSEYKRLMGERYHNGLRLDRTTYWTYSTIHRMLSNGIYAGDMVQGKYTRAAMYGRARLQDERHWIRVAGTHEPIISQGQWARVQRLMGIRVRSVSKAGAADPLSGIVKCGECGRATTIRREGERTFYSCSSYERYGADACARNRVQAQWLRSLIVHDLNRLIFGSPLVNKVEAELSRCGVSANARGNERLKAAVSRIRSLERGAYEDYREGILSREDYLEYSRDYERKEQQLNSQLAAAEDAMRRHDCAWAKNISKMGGIDAEGLDRVTVLETISAISIYRDGRIGIDYRFSNDCIGR